MLCNPSLVFLFQLLTVHLIVCSVHIHICFPRVISESKTAGLKNRNMLKGVGVCYQVVLHVVLPNAFPPARI